MVFQTVPAALKNDINFLITDNQNEKNIIRTNNLEEKVNLLIIRDLQRLNWSIQYKEKKIEITPPEYYDKEVIKYSMSIKRMEIINKNKSWIDNHIDYARNNLADGVDVLKSQIQPVIEVCSTQKQYDLFRLYRYFWSSPYSEYVGRRIKLIIRDAGLVNKPVIGIAALGSPIIHIPARDKYIGWNKDTRTKKINYMMDAYVIGALPPYNYLLGGKLISVLLTSKEIRRIFKKKYKNTAYSELAGLFTTSLYEKSSQYNRIVYDGRKIYEPIGNTKGFGTLHLTMETINTMVDYLRKKNIIVSNVFGNGPSWTMRVIRTTGDLLGFDTDQLLTHSFKRKIYFIPFAKNTKKYLNGENEKLDFYSKNIDILTEYWKNRWYNNRRNNFEIIKKVFDFKKENFII
ncbi:MAG: DUF4338 domain-containing protein [Treponema sp.]|nr:DUF4338 domain-containing protein [Treponema sp.]